MEIKPKSIIGILALLAVLGIATLSALQADSYTFSETMEFKLITPTVPETYTGFQTVQALMNAYDAEYNRRHSKTTVTAGSKSSQFTLSEIDARYPRAAWLQMLLKKGITIKNFHEYASSLSKRHTLAFLEDNPDLRKAGILGISPTDNWETYKAAYIDKLVSINTQIQNSVTAIEASKARIEAAKTRIEGIRSDRNPTVPDALMVPDVSKINIPTPPNVPISPRVPQHLIDLTELEEMTFPTLQSLVNQLQQTMKDLERQHRWKDVEQVREILEHVKEMLKQTEKVNPSLNEPKWNMKKTSRYPPL